MIRERILIPSLFTLTALALGGCESSGEHGTEKSEAHEAHEGHEAHAEAEEGQELFEMKAPATSLAAAVTTAQQSVPGGRFLQAEMEEEDGKAICSILLASGDGVKEVNVDVTTGKILATESEKLDPEASTLLAGIDKDPKSAACTAVKAIEAALAKAPGAWAFATGLGRHEGQLVYTVFLFDGKAPKVAEVSAADGNVQKLSDLQTEDEEEGEEGMEESKEAPEAKPK